MKIRLSIRHSVCLVWVLLALHAAAQMTVTNTGTGGSSGIQMTDGSGISASTTQVSIWADQGTSRGILNNGGFASVGPLPIAVWAMHVQR
jgi:hypothetical protein